MLTEDISEISRDAVRRLLDRQLGKVANPRTAQTVLAALRRTVCDFNDIGRLLSTDPVLSAKVVALANLIRPEHQPVVESINRSVQMLGVHQVSLVVMSVMLRSGLMLEGDGEQSPHELWRWVLSMAVAGNWLHRRLTEEEAAGSEIESVVNGLLVGLGPLVMHALSGERYRRLLGSPTRPMKLATRERQVFGVDHHRVGVWALDALGCPEELGEEVRAMSSGRPSRRSLIGRCIEVLAARIADLQPADAEAWLADGLPRLGIAADDANSVEALRSFRAELDDLASVLEVDLGVWAPAELFDPLELMRQAGEHLESLLVQTLTADTAAATDTAREAACAVAEEVAAQQAHADQLTGLLNRRGWLHALRTDLPDDDTPVGLLVVDIDYFKQINDRFGHAEGDRVLQRTARELESAKPRPLMVGRLGGDEFAAVFETTSPAELHTVAERLRVALSCVSVAQEGSISLSLGGLVAPAESLRQAWDQAFEQADRQLYRAKKAGRSRSAVAGHSD